MKNYEASFKRILAGLLVFGLMLIFVISSSCDADIEVDQTVEEIESATPIISSFSPSSAEILEDVLVEGEFLQFVDRATIGGIPTEIKSKISDTQILLRVDPAVVSGPIILINDLSRQGAENLEFTATSTESLTVSYPVPSVTSAIPSEATANDLLIIEGANLGVVSSVTFGGVPGVISFQENGVIVVTVPNPGTLAPVAINLIYNSNSGEIAQELSASFLVNIPTPEPSNTPRIMTKDNVVTITGNNMDFTSSVTINGVDTEILESENPITQLNFIVPATIQTGIVEVILTDTEMRQTIFNIPYINGPYYEYYDFDTKALETVRDNKNGDPTEVVLSLGEDEAEQPRFPGMTESFGSRYLHLDYPKATTSTLASIYCYDFSDDFGTEEMGEESAALLDPAGRFGGNPVLHFWMRINGANCRTKIYLGTSSAQRRESNGPLLDTGGEWVLVAVRLNGFMDSAADFSRFHFRLTAGSSSDNIPRSADYDWIIVTDRVLTEFGAVDYSAASITDETNWKDQG
ncbi:IPT/TIG domain-containing protein [uncultured Aquimarina sp.]|uniref:IPT/TIG domain-containing protein n=1 Tax=uncultured Aquimarina sp. TaxID=575652 RepID=UPI00260D50AD|nr:IPT/TIG domain-containing protein [uncultured Aquimarina sp.]